MCVKLSSANLICQAFTVLWKYLFDVRYQRLPTRTGQEKFTCVGLLCAPVNMCKMTKCQLEKTLQRKEVRKRVGDGFFPGGHRRPSRGGRIGDLISKDETELSR